MEPDPSKPTISHSNALCCSQDAPPQHRSLQGRVRSPPHKPNPALPTTRPRTTHRFGLPPLRITLSWPAPPAPLRSPHGRGQKKRFLAPNLSELCRQKSALRQIPQQSRSFAMVGRTVAGLVNASLGLVEVGSRLPGRNYGLGLRDRHIK